MNRFSLFHNPDGEALRVALSYTQGMVKFAHFATLILVAITASADEISDVEADVRCQEIAFSRSAENKNIESFRSFLDSDARFVGRSVDRGPDEITTAWEIFFAEEGPAIKWRPQFVEVLEDGMLALTRGPYRVISKDDDGKPVEHWGTFNSIWRKNVGGRWRVVFDAGSDAAKPPNEETKALLEQEEIC